MRFFSHIVFVLILSACSLFAQQDIISSGPMPGFSEMREAMLWVQTTQPTEIQFAYYDLDAPERVYTTEKYTTKKETGFTAHLLADSLEPGKRYGYEVYADGKKVEFSYPLEFQSQELWQWRTDPPVFTFVTGSGAYINEPEYDRPGKAYGGDPAIFETMHEMRPDFMVWLGDNVYFREVDWFTRMGMIKRYTHDRAIPEMQALLASTHHYAIWDDHDYGPNNSDRGFRNKIDAREVFKMFWANPTYGIEGQDGTASMFRWGDVDFFLLDNRWSRSPEHREFTDRVILGDAQIEWLIDNLVYSRAPFKIVVIGGQFLNPAMVFENHSTYPEERQKLLTLIEKEEIPGVLFLTGDRHHTELTVMERDGTYPLYDFTISPFTSGVHGDVNEPNYMREEGSLITERNFGLFEFSGERKDRTMKCEVYNTEGELLWTKSIHEDELK